MSAKFPEFALQRRNSVAAAAKAAGWMDGEKRALGARTPLRLVKQAKSQSGIESTTELIEYALAKVALEDDFGPKLLKRKGSIPADIDLGI